MPKTKTNKKKYKKIFSIKIIGVFLGLVFCISYLGVMNASAVKGYEMRKVEKKISELRKENKQLEIQLAESGSLHKVREGLGEMDMLERGEIIYLQENGPMALK